LKIKLIWSKTQHTLFNTCSFLIVFYFKNRNWPVVRLKEFFLLWFFMSILISDLRYIIWWYVMRWPSVNFKKTRYSSQNLRLYEEKLSLLSTYFISMYNNQYLSLCTILMERLKFWECHLSVEIAYLIKKGF